MWDLICSEAVQSLKTDPINTNHSGAAAVEPFNCITKLKSAKALLVCNTATFPASEAYTAKHKLTKEELLWKLLKNKIQIKSQNLFIIFNYKKRYVHV